MDPKEKSRAPCRGLVHPAVEAPGARLALPAAASPCPRPPWPQGGFTRASRARADPALWAALKTPFSVCRVHTRHFADGQEQKVLFHRTEPFIHLHFGF